MADDGFQAPPIVLAASNIVGRMPAVIKWRAATMPEVPAPKQAVG
jgi:hypothetical protein